jgi:hypothetical protein
VLSLSKHVWSPPPALRQAQGEVVIALTLRRHCESVLSLAGIIGRECSPLSRAVRINRLDAAVLA